MRKDRFSAKERVLKALNFEEPDRVPFHLWLEQGVIEGYQSLYGRGFDPVRHFGSDVISHVLWYGFPTGKRIRKDGIQWQEPLVSSLDELDDYQFPDASRASIYADLDQMIAKQGQHYPIFVWTIGVLDMATHLRSYQEIFLDMYDHPSKLKQVMERISSVLERGVETVSRRKIDVLFIGDDLCDRNGLMLSHQQLDEFVWPYDGRLIEIAKKHHIKVGFHSDGNVGPLLGKLREREVDVVNPLQPTVNDLKQFKASYGKTMVVYGGFDNTVTLEKSITDIEEHIVGVFEILGPEGGFVMSCHEIPRSTPLERIDRIAEIIKARCRYRS